MISADDDSPVPDISLDSIWACLFGSCCGYRCCELAVRQQWPLEQRVSLACHRRFRIDGLEVVPHALPVLHQAVGYRGPAYRQRCILLQVPTLRCEPRCADAELTHLGAAVDSPAAPKDQGHRQRTPHDPRPYKGLIAACSLVCPYHFATLRVSQSGTKAARLLRLAANSYDALMGRGEQKSRAMSAEGPAAANRAMVMRLWILPFLVACCLSLFLMMASYATTSSGKQDLLVFLDHEPVTEEDVLAHLGAASASFERDRVLSYRLHRDKSGYLIQAMGPHDSCWAGVNYDLVMVFDANWIMQRHNLVAIRAPK